MAPPIIEVVQALLFRYAAVIDDGDLTDWPGFFAEDAEYRLTPRENFLRGLPASLIYCKNRAMMRDRVIAIKKATVYTPQYYRHHYSNILVERSPGHATLRANYLVCRTQDDGDTIVFSTGRLIAAVSVPEEPGLFSAPPPASVSSLQPKPDFSASDAAPWTVRSPGTEGGVPSEPRRSSMPSIPGVPRLPSIKPSVPPPSSSDAPLSLPPPSRRRPTVTPLFLSMTVIYDTCRIPGLLVFPI
jgi:anthranilate 1,2-dioxygenase small subunit